MKKFIKLIVIAIAFLEVGTLVAQQDPNFNMYRFNMNIINPAYAGSTENAEIQLMHKNQWLGFEDAPSTQTLFYSAPYKKGLGIGASIVHDNVFVLDQTNASFDISYKLQLNETYDLFFGVKPGVSLTSIDLTQIGRDGVSDGLFDRTESYAAPLFGLGFYLRSENLYVTLSTPNVVNGDRFVKEKGAPTAVTNKPHVYFGAGYTFTVSNSLKVTPEFMVRAVEGAPTSYNTAINFEIYEKINAGINTRIDENTGVYGLFNVNETLSLGLGYDFTVSKIVQTDNFSSLEFLAKYTFF